MGNFKEYIKQEEESISNFYKALKNNEIKSNRIPNVRLAIFTNSLNKTVAHYSAGNPKAMVTQSLIEAITAFELGFKWEGFAHSYAMYDQMVWMLSLAILCEISDTDFRCITAIIKRDMANDLLLSTLIQYRQSDFLQGQSYIQKTPYSHLDPLVSGRDKSIAFIQKYLDKKWYQGHRDAPWHDWHKNTTFNIYFGYWAWEVAALVKIYQIEDSLLQNQKYYPYRALHW